MSSAITHALSDIRYQIPRQILEAVFTPSTKYGMSRLQFTGASIDSTIREKVINGRVRRDIDTFGVQEEIISLNGLNIETVHDNVFPGFSVHVPKDRTGGRSITTPLEVMLAPMGMGLGFMGGLSGQYSTNNNCCQTSNILKAMKDVVNSNNDVAINSTSEVSLIGENTIYVKNFGLFTGQLALRCILSSDPEFSNLKRPSWRIFSKLCVKACKAYIYNEYRIKMDEDELHGGLPLGNFKSTIEEYSSANDDYQTMLEEDIGKVLSFNDDRRMDRFVAGMFGRYP